MITEVNHFVPPLLHDTQGIGNTLVSMLEECAKSFDQQVVEHERLNKIGIQAQIAILQLEIDRINSELVQEKTLAKIGLRNQDLIRNKRIEMNTNQIKLGQLVLEVKSSVGPFVLGLNTELDKLQFIAKSIMVAFYLLNIFTL